VEEPPELDRDVAGIAALDQPLRRKLYRLLCRAGGWTSRDEASEALGVGRPVAAFHLDRLVDAGVVETRFKRLTGRSGPGAGRPAKQYRPTAGDLSASVPTRHYDLAASLLAGAVAEATRTGRPVAGCLRAAAQAAGRAVGVGARQVAGPAVAAARREAATAVLGRHGYEPLLVGDEIVLANCPFHRLAEEHRSLVCGMNLDFLGGLLAGLGPPGALVARLEPEPGYCCVRITAATRSS
jgi:predicted ArsR family transcriptional regulator